MISISWMAGTSLKSSGATTEHLTIETQADLLPDTSMNSLDTAYDRQLAQTLVNIALNQLGDQQSSSGNHARYALVRPIFARCATSTPASSMPLRISKTISLICCEPWAEIQFIRKCHDRSQ